MPIRQEQGRLHPLLVLEGFWRERVRRMSEVEPRPLIYPRDDLSEPGLRVEEFHIRAHDGEPIRGLVARSLFRGADQPVTLKVARELDEAILDRERLREGEAWIVVRLPESRHLQDRVLDIVRTARALTTLDSVALNDLGFELPGTDCDCDALRIARHLLTEASLD